MQLRELRAHPVFRDARALGESNIFFYISDLALSLSTFWDIEFRVWKIVDGGIFRCGVELYIVYINNCCGLVKF